MALQGALTVTPEKPLSLRKVGEDNSGRENRLLLKSWTRKSVSMRSIGGGAAAGLRD